MKDGSQCSCILLFNKPNKTKTELESREKCNSFATHQYTLTIFDKRTEETEGIIHSAVGRRASINRWKSPLKGQGRK